jgi:amino acid transporter
MRQLLLFVKSWLNGLYLVAFAFIGAGVVLVLLPELKGQIWQIIEGALLGAGFTILVITISLNGKLYWSKRASIAAR